MKKYFLILAAIIATLVGAQYAGARIYNPPASGLSSLTPWTENIDADGFSLTGLLNLTSTGTTTLATTTASKLTVTGQTDLATTTATLFTTTGNVGIASSTPSNKLTLGSGSITTTENAVATSTTMTVNWTEGNQQLVKISTAGVAVTFSNYVAGQNLKMVVCNPPTGTAGALTFSTAVYWVNKTAPTQTTTANSCDVYSFFSTKATSTTPIIFGAMSPNF